MSNLNRHIATSFFKLFIAVDTWQPKILVIWWQQANKIVHVNIVNFIAYGWSANNPTTKLSCKSQQDSATTKVSTLKTLDYAVFDQLFEAHL